VNHADSWMRTASTGFIPVEREIVKMAAPAPVFPIFAPLPQGQWRRENLDCVVH